ERKFRCCTPGATFFLDKLVGAPACEKDPPHCDLSRGVVANDAARTVVFRLRRPDSQLLYTLGSFRWSAPVPPGTADTRPTPNGDVIVDRPGTGPYRVARSRGNEILYVRNPFFHEWSDAAQPDGNPDRILLRFGLSSEVAFREVVRG